MPHFMRPIDRVHAERQLIEALVDQMSAEEVDVFFRRMRIPRPVLKKGIYETLHTLARGYVTQCSDDGLMSRSN